VRTAAVSFFESRTPAASKGTPSAVGGGGVEQPVAASHASQRPAVARVGDSQDGGGDVQ